jgi:ribokinase
MASDPPTIAVIGSANIDLVAYVERVPGSGETVLGRRLAQSFGGKGANQAVMASRLGARVAFVGAIGDDSYAGETIASFRGEGIDIEGLARVPGPSGLASIWVEPDGTNRIVVIAGANGLVQPSEAAGAIERLPALDVLVGQLEIPQAATTAAFRTAKARGATTVLNPAPAADLDRALLELTDWLVPNEVEVAQLAGRAIADSDADLTAFGTTAGRGLAVTLGAAGAALVWDKGVERMPSPVVEAVDTTGAGDAFVGAFAVGLALGLEPRKAVRLGIACGADSVTRPGAQGSYPDRQRAAAILASVRKASDAG